jgi:hypothetical protein
MSVPAVFGPILDRIGTTSAAFFIYMERFLAAVD